MHSGGFTELLQKDAKFAKAGTGTVKFGSWSNTFTEGRKGREEELYRMMDVRTEAREEREVLFKLVSPTRRKKIKNFCVFFACSACFVAVFACLSSCFLRVCSVSIAKYTDTVRAESDGDLRQYCFNGHPLPPLFYPKKSYKFV
jgi:hypothetical protein